MKHLPLVAFVLCFSFAAPARADGRFEGDYVIRKGETVFGDVRTVREESPGRLELSSAQRVRFSLLSVEQEVRETVRMAVDRVAGTAEVGIESQSLFKSRSLEIRLAGRRAELIDHAAGERRGFTADEPIFFCMDYFLGRDLARLAPGERFAYPVVDPDTARLETQEVEVAAVGTGEVTFRIRRALYRSVETYDHRLDLVRAEVESLGLVIERTGGAARDGTLSTYAIAGGDLLEYPLDIPPARLHRAKRLELTLAWRGIAPEELSLADIRQGIVVTEDDGDHRTAEVTVRRLDLARRFRVRVDRIDTTEVGAYLRPTPFIRSESEAIRAFRDRVVGDERRLDRIVRRACAAVAERVRPEILPELLTSDEVLAAGRGMCMQTGILLAALLRSAGVPTRCVMGLKASGDRLLPHLANEVWNGEAWLPVDATDPAALQTHMPADMIRLGVGADLPELTTLKSRLLNNLRLAGLRAE